MSLMIAPSLHSADVSRLAEEVRLVEEAGAGILHLDVMDGHFAPNLTFGPAVCKAIKRHATRPVDTHLMLDHPGDFAERFIEAGSDWVSFHIEAVKEPVPLIETIRKAGARAGLTLSPPTPLSAIEPYLSGLDFVLVMTVNPGFSGQKMLPECVAKIAELRRKVGDSFDIEVDGGVNLETIRIVAEAGANVVVAGSAAFGTPDTAEAIRSLSQALREHSTLVRR